MGTRHTLEDEFRDFVAARSPALLRTAYLLAGDWATAEDLLQTALTKTYLAWKRLGGIEAVEPYARRVLVNTATSWWRRRWHGERPTEVLPERAGPDRISEQLERDALWRHLQTLPARQRAVLVLRFYEDLSEAQTAELLNISPGTVKSQTFRALAALRKRLGADLPDVPADAPEPTQGRAGAARDRVADQVGAADRGRARRPGTGTGRSAQPEADPAAAAGSRSGGTVRSGPGPAGPGGGGRPYPTREPGPATPGGPGSPVPCVPAPAGAPAYDRSVPVGSALSAPARPGTGVED